MSPMRYGFYDFLVVLFDRTFCTLMNHILPLFFDQLVYAFVK